MNYIERLRNSVMVKMVLSYSILAVALIGIFAVSVYSGTNELMVDEISLQSGFRLEKVSTFTEQALLKKYEESFQSKIYPASDATISMDSSLLYFLDRPRVGNESRVIELVRSLNTSKYAYSETDNITLYFLRSDFLVDNQYFYESPGSHPDTDFVTSLPERPAYTWFQRATPKGEKMLTYVYALPYKAEGSRVRGYMYIDIKVDSIRLLYRDMMQMSDENLYVFDREGRLILSTLQQNTEELGWIADLPAGNETAIALKKGADGRKVVALLPQEQSSLGWSYAIVRPMDNFFLSSSRMRDQIFVVCGLVLVFGIVLSYFLSRRLYLPLKGLLFNIRNLYALPKPFQHLNGYKMIDSALHQLDYKVASLQNELKTKQLYQLLNGHAAELKGELHIPLETDYAVALVQLPAGRLHEFADWYAKRTRTIAFEAVPISDTELALVFFPQRGSPGSQEEITQSLEKFQLMCRQTLQFRCAVGDVVRSLEHIHLSYLKARETNRYFFLHADRAILTSQMLAGRSGFASTVSFVAFENALKAGDGKAVEQIVGQFRDDLAESGMNIEAVQLTVIQMVHALAQAIVELNLHDKIVTVAELFDQYKKDTLDETMAWVLGLCREVELYLNAQLKNGHRTMILQLAEYIDANYCEDISLDILADKAGLSTSYISKLFGEVMHVSFTEYLSSVRLRVAADMLRGGNVAVKEISRQTGYRNVQYFCTKFKERYGVTPIQYRNANAATEDVLGSVGS